MDGRNEITRPRDADDRRGGWRLALPVVLLLVEPGCMIQRDRHVARSSPDDPPGLSNAATLGVNPRALLPWGWGWRWTPPPASGTDLGQSVARPAAALPSALDPAAKPASAVAVAANAPDDTPAPPPTTGPAEHIPPADVVWIGPTPPALPPPPSEYPIDLTTSLRLAERENPVIAESRARIGEALALQQQANALLLPTFNGGTNYHGHTGNLQRASGRILNLSEQSLYVGGGSRTLAAESVAFPAVRIFSPLTDAIFEPLAARQQVDVTRYAATATANTVLLEVADLFLALAGTEARLDALSRTVDEAREVARLNVAYARVGQGPPADADRSLTELKLFQAEAQRAEEEVAVASARLVQRLHLDPGVRVRPRTQLVDPITLVDPSRPLPELIEVGLRGRPEMGATGAAVAEAQIRFREEKARPLLPTVSLGFSAGAFGGGSNLVQPLLGRFGGRTDLDVMAFWTLQNFGVGNAALQKARRSAVGQAESIRVRTANVIRREVTDAVARSQARLQQVDTARVELASAEKGFAEDLLRAEGAVGRPLEVLDSLKLLARARLTLIRSVVEYDQSQFSLFVSLGSPPPLETPANGPIPAAPMASPRVSSLWESSTPLPPPVPLPPPSTR